jgi:hypothetical protein
MMEEARRSREDARLAASGVAGLFGGMGAGDLAVGRVLAVENEAVQLLTEEGRALCARRAAACLLAPETGDTVLLFDRGQSAYILSVLEKANDASTLQFSGDVKIESPGAASLAAREVALTGEQARVSGREVKVSGVSGEFTFVETSVASKRLRLRLDKAVCAARVVESTVGSVLQRIKHCFRHVSEVDTLKAGSVRRFVSGRFFQRSRDAAILADETVKVDGDKIELG